MASPRAERIYRLFPFVVALLAFAAFVPALQNDFVNWDDDKNFLNNVHYRGLGWTQLHWMWTSYLMGRYIPLTWMTLGLDYKLWGMDPMGYHLVNLIWHAACAVVFYYVTLTLFEIAVPESSTLRRKLPLGALVAALLFAIHPLRVESVAWATERRDVVSGVFFLLAVLVYIKRKSYWLCFGFFVLALLSKEIAVTLPLILLILDVYPLRRIGPGRWLNAAAWRVYLEKVPFIVFSIADSAMALYAGGQENLTSSIEHLGWFARFAISVYGLGFYIWKTLAPIHLAPFYALTAHRLDPRALPFQLSGLIIIWITAAALMFRRKLPALSAAWLAYIVLLIPVLGFFHNGQQIAADRYSYLACLGWAVLAGYLFLRLLDWRGNAVAAGAIILVGGLGILTWRQTGYWRDSETLWEHSAAVEPSYIAFNNIGNVLVERGDAIGGLENFQKSIRLNQRYAQAHNNAGSAYADLHDWDRAMAEFLTAIQLKPDLPNAHGGLGYVLAQQGKYDESIRELRIALQINPEFVSAQRQLDRVLEAKRQAAGNH